MTMDFTDQQKRYLEGFVSGVQASRAAAGLKPVSGAGGTGEPTGPDAGHLKAMAKLESSGKKLSDQEKWKRDEHPLDAYARLKKEAEAGTHPKPADNFRWRFHGLFYVGPTQTSYMCRVRVPNGILSHWQFRAVADLAKRYGGGYAHVTTRAGLQIRELAPEHGPVFIETLSDIGLISRGSGADNIRNVTGSATAGIDRQELIDTRPYARSWHHHILNTRALLGLPRKFNVSFDGGGAIPTLEDTNDIAFTAVTVTDGAGEGIAPGVWFRLALGGITGHMDLARPTGVYVAPDETTAVADAIVRVFSDHGDRTDRKKARLKYVLDQLGFEKFLELVEEKLGRKLTRIANGCIVEPSPADRTAHLGVHPQKQDGLVWIGVLTPVGHMTVEQMQALADIAQQYGDGDIRLTVWQNLLISGVRKEKADEVETWLKAAGLTSITTPVRAGLVACTGNVGCKFAASNTKSTAREIADWVEPRVPLDTPINIHVTGCHHSCAQHYIGDIGLIAARVPVAPESEDTVEGFHICVGGGFGIEGCIGRELYRDVKREQCPPLVERMLKAYLAQRASPGETFVTFSRRHDLDALRTLFGAAP